MLWNAPAPAGVLQGFNDTDIQLQQRMAYDPLNRPTINAAWAGGAERRGGRPTCTTGPASPPSHRPAGSAGRWRYVTRDRRYVMVHAIRYDPNDGKGRQNWFFY